MNERSRGYEPQWETGIPSRISVLVGTVRFELTTVRLSADCTNRCATCPSVEHVMMGSAVSGTCMVLVGAEGLEPPTLGM